MEKKHILFYSKFCNHCHDILSEIVKKDIRHFFVLVCVEKREFPYFVDRVPFVITNDKEFLVDEAISEFIEKISDVKADVSVAAFSLCPRGHFGNDFSYIDEDTNGPPQDLNSVQNYVFISDSVSAPINTPATSNSKEKLSDAHYEEFMKKRDTEVPVGTRKLI